LKGNGLAVLPKMVCKHLPLLKTLILSNNQLCDLPKQISSLQYLELIALDHNLFTEFPLSLFEAPLSDSLLKINAQVNIRLLIFCVKWHFFLICFKKKGDLLLLLLLFFKSLMQQHFISLSCFLKSGQ
jgi:Leucine-rich repeat (LRR) protein